MAAGVAAGLEAASGAGLLSLEERREDQHDQRPLAGFPRLEPDGSARSKLQRGVRSLGKPVRPSPPVGGCTGAAT
jgi:hypothetical protein